MAFSELHYFSSSLGKACSAYVILPEKPAPAGGYPVFYLLHGLSDDHTIWIRRTSIERYVQDLPLIVVMPDGGRSFYVDGIDGDKYGSAMSGDLVKYVDKVYRTKADRTGRCVGGLSMGGYGAMRLALGHPDLYCSATSHSGAVGWGHAPIPAEQKEWRRILGENPVGGPNDLFQLAKMIDKAHMPALRIDCGTSDFLLQSNREFHKHLTDIGLPHEYEEFPGSHEWSYWDKHVQEAIAFHRKNLGL